MINVNVIIIFLMDGILISLLIYMGIGLLGGILAGLLGLGGGLIVVPLLAIYFADLGFSPEILIHIAVGTSLAAMITTTSFSAWVHLKHEDVWTIYRLMAWGVVFGSLFGSLAADFVHSNVLSITFGTFAILFSLQIFFVKWKPRQGAPRTGVTIGCSVLIGMISALLGIGAGTAGLPFLTSYQKTSMHRAVAVAAALSFTVSIVGTATYLIAGLNEPLLPDWATGYLYWPAVLGISLGSPLSAWASAKIAHKLPVITLRRIFAIVLFIIGVRMLFF